MSEPHEPWRAPYTAHNQTNPHAHPTHTLKVKCESWGEGGCVNKELCINKNEGRRCMVGWFLCALRSTG